MMPFENCPCQVVELSTAYSLTAVTPSGFLLSVEAFSDNILRTAVGTDDFARRPTQPSHRFINLFVVQHVL